MYTFLHCPKLIPENPALKPLVYVESEDQPLLSCSLGQSALFVAVFLAK